MLPNPLTEAREAAHAAYIDASTLGVEPEDRINAVFDAVVLALRAHGVLSVEDPTPTLAQLTADAQFLATASDFPRYTSGDGWMHLRSYGSDVRCAYLKATANLGLGQEALASHLGLVQQRLLENLEESSP